MPTGTRILKGLTLVFWICLSVGVLGLLVAAMETRNGKACQAVKIDLVAGRNAGFIGREDISRILEGIAGKMVGKSLDDFDLKRMEDSLEHQPWVGDAELYFDNKRVLQVRVAAKEPVARVFAAGGDSFYLDTALSRLPLSNTFTPRLPVFTGYPFDLDKVSSADSMLLGQVRDIGLYLAADSFWMAQVDQVDIGAQGQFTMVPKVGEHTIRFGDGSDVRRKFRKLRIFYQEVMSKTGWNRYSAVDVSFGGQVVATRKEAAEIRSDTTLASRQVKLMIRNLREQALKDTMHTRTVTTTRIKEQL